MRLRKAAFLAPIAVVLLAFGAWEISLAGLSPASTIVFHVIGGTLSFCLGAAFLVYLSVLLISRKILGVLFK